MNVTVQEVGFDCLQKINLQAVDHFCTLLGQLLTRRQKKLLKEESNNQREAMGIRG